MVSPYYPNQVPWTDKKDWVSPENPGDLVEADHVNQLYAEVNAIGQDVGSHKSDTANPHNVTKSQVGLANVDNVKQMPIAGGTFTGIAVAQNNTSYTTKQIRNITLSTAKPSGGSNGDVWLQYE